MPDIVRVLVVDDSAYVRKVVSQMLGAQPVHRGGRHRARRPRSARDGRTQLQPDVVTCDLNMPVMDGVAFVRAQMARRPVPIVIISIAAESGEQVLAALDAGAIDFVQKPTALATERLLDMADELVREGQGGGALRRCGARAGAAGRGRRRPVPRREAARPIDIVVIGISTGGPQALKVLIPQLPADFPVPVAMVLHMPVGYTEMYAQKLERDVGAARRRGAARARW